jgi:O-antigen/teichoic acid export membrane protein
VLEIFAKKIMSLTENQKKILSNVAWAFAGKIVNMVSALFVGILVARYLGPEQYGIMNYVISFVMIYSIVASFGMDNIEIRELSRHNANKNYILGTCFVIRLAFALVAYLLVYITLLIYRTDDFVMLMIMVYSLTLFTSCFNLFRNYFTSIIKNKLIVKSEIYRTVVGAAIKIILLLLNAPLWYFIFAAFFDTFLVASGYYLSYYLTVGSVRNWRFDRTKALFFIKESFPLLLSGAAVVIYQRIDQVMIGNMVDNVSVGYFATAGKFVDVILFLPLVLVQTITPMLVKSREKDVYLYEMQKRVFISITTWSAVFMSLFLSASSYWIIKATYGMEYISAVPVLQIMAWKTVGMALSSSSGQIIILEGLQKWSFVRNVLGCFLCVCLNFIFIPKMGIIASAWVTIITVFFTGFISNILIPPYYNVLKIQLYSLLFGWKDFVYLKRMIIKK